MLCLSKLSTRAKESPTSIEMMASFPQEKRMLRIKNFYGSVVFDSTFVDFLHSMVEVV